jgi:hypothetical protein
MPMPSLAQGSLATNAHRNDCYSTITTKHKSNTSSDPAAASPAQVQDSDSAQHYRRRRCRQQQAAF